METSYRMNGCKGFMDFAGVFLFSPQLWALIVYRIGHGIKNKFLYNLYVYFLWNPIRLITSIEIWPQAVIGKNFSIIHFGNILIHHNVKIGNNCTLQGECTMGLKFDGADDAARLEDGVKVGIRATLAGGVRIGKNSIIEANAFVTTSVPDNAMAIGNPARIVRKIET